MSSIWGKNIKISVFGESHSGAIGVVIDGLPPGIRLDLKRVAASMKRRMPVLANYSTTRREADEVEIVSGFFNGYTTGTPLTGIIRNKDAHSADYEEMKNKPRPSHADLTGSLKYRGFNDYRGGGHFSGRLTAPIVFAGSVAEQWLAESGVHVGAHILSIGDATDTPFTDEIAADDIAALRRKDFAVLDDTAGQKMRDAISGAKALEDSLGGVIECIAVGVPAGIGDPMFESVESVVAGMLFSIPAVKGIEFGAGFSIAQKKGSEANDAPAFRGGFLSYKSNNNGGVIGGIANGMPVIFRAALKPTPSIAAEQDTVDLSLKQNTKLKIKGRHDACIVPRAVEVLRCAFALCLADLMLEDKKYDRS
jgi:chorismate synthase